jgi:hypothetical protein
VQPAADGLAGLLLEGGTSLGAHFDELASRPAVAAGGFAADGAAAGPVEDQIAGVEFAGRVHDEAVLKAFDSGEIARVIVLDDAHRFDLRQFDMNGRVSVFGSRCARQRFCHGHLVRLKSQRVQRV